MNTKPPSARQGFTYVPNELLLGHDPLSKLILISLCAHANDDIPVTQRQIAEDTGCSLKTVKRRIRKLADLGVIYPGKKGWNNTVQWEISEDGGFKP